VGYSHSVQHFTLLNENFQTFF